jgi:SPP1 gp7 family putative phage head morphogenesis protein|tara:strand:- start:474 stop:1703 length:1230 start_codon:yes stop_codon:yes gene_type:complete
MSTPSELYRNAIDLNRFSNSVAKRIAVTYNDLVLDAVDRLRGIDELAAPAKAARLRAILAQLKQSLDGWAGTSTLAIVEDLQGLAVLQSEFVANELRRALPVELRRQIRSVQISPQFARSVATVDPTAINVVSLSDNLQAAVAGAPQTFQLTAAQGTTITLPNGKVLEKSFRGLAESQADLFAKTVRNGLLTGESADQIARQLKGRLRFGQPGSLRQIAQAGGQVTAAANHQVNAMVRTSINQVANEASQQVYKANQDVTRRYRYVATLDSKTSAICRALDGQEFDYGKGPTPPQHFNCRSTTVPVIDYSGLGIDPPPPSQLRRPNSAFKGTQAVRGQGVPDNETYGQWLDKQSMATKQDVLGRSKVPYFNRLVNKYGPTDAIRKFVNADGSELTLEQLKDRYPNEQAA